MLSGRASPRLLATYDAERRPIAWMRHDQTFARPDYSAHARRDAVAAPIIDDSAIELGQLYRSTAVLGAGMALPPALRPDEWKGQPGTRAPHAWVTVNGERRSTLDLFQHGWVLLAADERWRMAAGDAVKRRSIDLTCVCVGVDARSSDDDGLRAAFGIQASGASLVRPDGYVAWRSIEVPADPDGALEDALRQVLPTDDRVKVASDACGLL